MKQIMCQVFATVVLSSAVTAGAVAADDSPMDYFAEQDAENARTHAPVLAATTIEELINLDS